MEFAAPANDYFIWGIDDSHYGPVSLPVLLDWVKDERVLPDTWIFARNGGEWQKACEISELKDVFQADAGTVSETHSSVRFKPGSLRRIKILAEMKDAQLAHLADFLEFQEWRTAGAHNDGRPRNHPDHFRNRRFFWRDVAV
jgi:hypothetical protein